MMPRLGVSSVRIVGSLSSTPDLTDLAAQVARRDWRGRREIPFRYLLDSRLFRLLCRPGQTDALDGFRASLERHRLAPEGGLPDLEMTPLGILDALGIEPPRFPSLNIPKDMTARLQAGEFASVLVRTIKDDFEKAPELQAADLQRRADELRQQTDPAAHELFDLCLGRFASREGFVESILNHLAFDALFRFRFPEEYRERVSRVFDGVLLINEETVSGLSKMRRLKMFWDKSYERIVKKHPQARGEIQAVDQEIKPRTYQDFLGWEVVHYSVLGYPGKKIRPVIAFTPDSQVTLEARCRAHKTALRTFLDQIPREELATLFRPQIMAWTPGWLVPCSTDGTFDSAVSTGELPIF